MQTDDSEMKFVVIGSTAKTPRNLRRCIVRNVENWMRNVSGRDVLFPLWHRIPLNVQGGPKIGTFCTSYNFIKYWPMFKLFHCQNQEKICNSTITKDPATPQMSLYTSLHYLVKGQCLKATIENQTYVTTHFNKLTTGNNVFIVSVIV